MLFYISLFYIPHVAVTRFFARVRMLNERYQRIFFVSYHPTFSFSDSKNDDDDENAEQRRIDRCRGFVCGSRKLG